MKDYLIRLLRQVKRSRNKFRYQSSLSCRANDAKSSTVSGTSMTVRQYFPSVTPFPRRTPQRNQLPRCSPASSVLRTHLTSHQRSCQPYPQRGSLTAAACGRNRVTADRWDLPVLAFGISTHAQVQRLRRVRVDLAIVRSLRCCLPFDRTRSAHEREDFGAR